MSRSVALLGAALLIAGATAAQAGAPPDPLAALEAQLDNPAFSQEWRFCKAIDAGASAAGKLLAEINATGNDIRINQLRGTAAWLQVWRDEHVAKIMLATKLGFSWEFSLAEDIKIVKRNFNDGKGDVNYIHLVLKPVTCNSNVTFVAETPETAKLDADLADVGVEDFLDVSGVMLPRGNPEETVARGLDHDKWGEKAFMSPTYVFKATSIKNVAKEAAASVARGDQAGD